MSIRYESRNGKKYAYQCTSSRVPGKKYPISKKVYLGVVDQDTGNLIPKKVQSESFNFTLKDGKFRTKDYGNVILIKHIAESIGMDYDLEYSFGTAARGTMALAIAQAMAPTPFMDTQYTIESSYIRESLDLDTMDFSSQRLSEIMTILGEATGCTEDLFALRAKRCSDSTFLYDITSHSTYSEMDGNAEYGHNRDGESMKQINLGLLTDKEGLPVAFDIFPGSISDITTLKRLVGDMKKRSPQCRLVADRGFESANNVALMLNSGIDFIMPCTINCKALKSIVTDFSRDVMKPEYDRMHCGHVYSVKERHLGVMKFDDDRYCYVADDEPEYQSCEIKVKAYVCFDSKKRSDDEQELKTALMNIINELNGKKVRKPEEYFQKKAKWMSKYLDMTVEDGTMRIEYKQNAMSFFRNRAGMFVMLTPDAEWDVVMTSYDARDNVEKAFDILKTELDGKRMRTGDPVRARGRFLVKFLALMIRVKMQNTISDKGPKDLTVENALLSAATYKIIDEKGLKVRTEKSKRVRQIFELFGVDDPENINGVTD